MGAATRSNYFKWGFLFVLTMVLTVEIAEAFIPDALFVLLALGGLFIGYSVFLLLSNPLVEKNTEARSR